MNVDRETLIKLIEAMLDGAQILQCELALYHSLFTIACQNKGLNDKQIADIIDRARSSQMSRIVAHYAPTHQNLLAKVPEIVDLLASDQEKALNILREWTPKGRIN